MSAESESRREDRPEAVARAVVTGAGTGQGKAIANRLLSRGCSVLICGRRGDVLDAAVEELGSLGGRCERLEADLREPAEPARVVDACVELFGGIEVLVNNAGVADFCPFEEVSAETWDRAQALLARAPMLAIRAAVPHMVRAGWGRVINNSSLSSTLSEPGSTQYAAGKAAPDALTRSAAVDLARKGIRVNAIGTGWIRTPISEEFLAEAGADAFDAINPVGRVGEPDEIGAVAEFLALDAPDFLTGATINVDGGQSIFIPLPE